MTTVPSLNSGTTQNPPASIDRRHDLDALRAIAMLLGILLHAALSFAPIPWPVSDIQQNDFFTVLFAAIHGFRMPLFFLISGFFTAMLWRKRGLRGLIRQRTKRILIPLVFSCLTIIPAMWAVTSIVTLPSPFQSVDHSTDSVEIWQALSAGDVDRVALAIEESEIELDALHRDSGASMLTSAVFLGHTEIAKLLIESGADVNLRNRDQGTALHTAAFMGRAVEAKLLLESGADENALDAMGQSPTALLKTDFGTTAYIASSYGVTLDKDSLQSGRKAIAELLGAQEVLGKEQNLNSNSVATVVLGLLYHLPVFMHLWFLWFLCWLVALFMIYAIVADRIGLSRLPHWVLCSPAALIWLVPITMLPQLWMNPSSFGPDPSIGLLPIPSVLGYYAIFFFVGALYWDLDDRAGRLGRWWLPALLIAGVIIFPIGLDLTSGLSGIVPELESQVTKSIAANLMQAIYTWLMIIGSIGLFQRFFKSESKTMRYISDSSYWLYLAHLPLIFLAQWMVRDLSWPAILKFAVISVAVSGLLMVSYRYLVRYTMIGRMLNGRMLNGPRTRSHQFSKEITGLADQKVT